MIYLSALQHFDFCPRQCALIHSEQAWAENYLTAKGKQLHERVDSGEPEQRNGTRYERSVQVSSKKYNLIGKLDLLEIDMNTGNMTPVEYKKGKSKLSDCDRIQLCAQALCLEEMLNTKIPKGGIWYWQTRRRETIELSRALRDKTISTINSIKQLLEAEKLPPPVLKKHCDSCSLQDMCLPKTTSKDLSASYIKQLYLDQT